MEFLDYSVQEAEVLPREHTHGQLQIGSTLNNLVVINLPHEGIMHLGFTVPQAKEFINKML